jgi:uncharacterized RDD family membrane protein YckC
MLIPVWFEDSEGLTLIVWAFLSATGFFVLCPLALILFPGMDLFGSGSIAKRFLHLQIVDQRGFPASLGQRFERLLMKCVPIFPPISLVLIALGKRSLHELLSGTVVVVSPDPRAESGELRR